MSSSDLKPRRGPSRQFQITRLRQSFVQGAQQRPRPSFCCDFCDGRHATQIRFGGACFQEDTRLARTAIIGQGHIPVFPLRHDHRRHLPHNGGRRDDCAAAKGKAAFTKGLRAACLCASIKRQRINRDHKNAIGRQLPLQTPDYWREKLNTNTWKKCCRRAVAKPPLAQ